jgi:hypothetical protein
LEDRVRDEARKGKVASDDAMAFAFSYQRLYLLDNYQEN